MKKQSTDKSMLDRWMRCLLSCLGWLTIVAVYGGLPSMAEAQLGPEEEWRVLRPSDGTQFPEGTRIVVVMVTKPFGDAAIMRIEDPNGNLIEHQVPAIDPYFSRTIDLGGLELPPGHWEVTLFNSLEPLQAKTQSSFYILDGEIVAYFPTIEVPPEGEVYPANIPYIIFAGITGFGNTVWLEVYNEETMERLFVTETNAMPDGVWGYLRYWSHGSGKWLAVVYGADPSMGGGATDSTRFETKAEGVYDWPQMEFIRD